MRPDSGDSLVVLERTPPLRGRGFAPAALLLAFLGLALPGTANAGTVVDFSPPLTSAALIGEPSDVTLADVDGDLDDDVIVAEFGNGTVEVIANDGNGTFSAPVAFATGSPAFAVATGDFNDDGDPDLALGAQTGVKIMTGSSGATFSQPDSVGNATAVLGVNVGDFNLDGDPDLAATNVATDVVSIMTGTGAGTATFSDPVSFAVGDEPVGVTVGSFNGDSDPDLVVANSGPLAQGSPPFPDDSISILTGSSGAGFSVGAPITVTDGPEETAVADFDNDGEQDLAVAHAGSGTSGTTAISILRGTTGSTFTEPEPFSSPAPQDIATGDFNADGDADLASTAGGTHNVNVRLGSTGATFQKAQTFLAGPEGCCNEPLTVGDLNTDKLPDIVAGNYQTKRVSRILNVSDVTPPSTSITSGPAQSSRSADSTPTFGFSADEPGASFECRVDEAAFDTCSGPGDTHTTGTLSDGSHTFELRATDAAGNQGVVTRNFTIDTVAPGAVITGGPSGTTTDTTPTFSFEADQPGATLRCSLDSAVFTVCSSPLTLPELAPGEHSFRVTATDAAGNTDTTPATRVFTITAPPTPTPPNPAADDPVTLAELPAPVMGRKVNAAPVQGEVFVSVPTGSSARLAKAVPGIKGREFIPLREARQLPVGTLFDTRGGSVRLVTAAGSRTQTGNFIGGVFQTLQTRRARGLVELRLKGGSFRRCRTTRRRKRRRARRSDASPLAGSARRRRRRIRRLRGRGRGRFRTRGRYSSATVRGTTWTVADRCDGTLTKVSRGKVVVRDFRRKKRVTLRRGKSYLARAG